MEADPEGIGILAKVLAAGAAVLAPVGGLWVWIDNRFAKKHTVNNAVKELKAELAVQRGHIEKIFDQIRDGDERNEARHRELLMHLLKDKP